jgi:hypothetical protein
MDWFIACIVYVYLYLVNPWLMLYICLLAKKVSLDKKNVGYQIPRRHLVPAALSLSPFSFAVSLGEREQARRPPHMAGPLPLRNPMTPPSTVICDLTKKF